MKENLIKNYAYRILVDPINNIWVRLSFWKRDIDVFNSKGKNLGTTMNNIDGITDSVASSSDTMISSAKCGKILYSKVQNLKDEYSKALLNVIKALRNLGITIPDSPTPEQISNGIKNVTSSMSVFHTSPVNMKDYTTRWSELTTSDFICGSIDVGCSARAKKNEHSDKSHGKSATTSATLSYNNKTGILTFDIETKQTGNDGDDHATAISNDTVAIWLNTFGGK